MFNNSHIQNCLSNALKGAHFSAVMFTFSYKHQSRLNKINLIVTSDYKHTIPSTHYSIYNH